MECKHNKNGICTEDCENRFRACFCIGFESMCKRYVSAETERISKLASVYTNGITAHKCKTCCNNGNMQEGCIGCAIEYALSKLIVEEPQNKELDVTIESLWENKLISIRVRNCLVRNGIKTVRDLVATKTVDLRKIRGLGLHCVAEINKYLASKGFKEKVWERKS